MDKFKKMLSGFSNEITNNKKERPFDYEPVCDEVLKRIMQAVMRYYREDDPAFIIGYRVKAYQMDEAVDHFSKVIVYMNDLLGLDMDYKKDTKLINGEYVEGINARTSPVFMSKQKKFELIVTLYLDDEKVDNILRKFSQLPTKHPFKDINQNIETQKNKSIKFAA